MARLGVAGQGKARLGRARRGKARNKDGFATTETTGKSKR